MFFGPMFGDSRARDFITSYPYVQHRSSWFDVLCVSSAARAEAIYAGFGACVSVWMPNVSIYDNRLAYNSVGRLDSAKLHKST